MFDSVGVTLSHLANPAVQQNALMWLFWKSILRISVQTTRQSPVEWELPTQQKLIPGEPNMTPYPKITLFAPSDSLQLTLQAE